MKKTGPITEITLENAGRFVLYEICPGILFAFNEVYTSVLPKIAPQEADDCICTINYATSGTCGLYSSKGKYIYLRAGELMISNEQAERLLASDLTNRETIAHIAKDMGISATSLKNYFRAVYGQNISAYLKEKRISEAKKLLTETKLSILEIANRVGFESQSKFTAMFHAALGLTPTEFRQSSRRIN